MSDSKHTPGPWTISDVDSCQVIDSEAQPVVNTWDGQEQDGANARLIAAAPELLAVCRRIMVGVDEGYVKMNGAIGIMVANAIAKAERGTE